MTENIRVCRTMYKANEQNHYRQIVARTDGAEFYVEIYEGVVKTFNPFKAERSAGFPLRIECASNQDAWDGAGKEQEESLTKGWREHDPIFDFLT
jgi:hypothetical protein